MTMKKWIFTILALTTLCLGAILSSCGSLSSAENATAFLPNIGY